MPELPEIEVAKKYVDATSLHQKIKEVWTGDEIIFDESPSTLKSDLKNRELEETHRIGKHLLLKVNADFWLTVHFGMTGKFEYYKGEDMHPQYRQFTLGFANGYYLSFVCPRKLGRIGKVENPGTYTKKKKLGPDALRISKEEFRKLLDGKRGKIKSALMDQKMISGIGNIYADEILFQSRIHPESKTEKLSEKQREELYEKMEKVWKITIEKGARYDQYPASFIIPVRKEGEDCPGEKGKVKRIKIGGRSTYFCPGVQKKSS